MIFKFSLKKNTKISKPVLDNEVGWVGDYADEIKQAIVAIDPSLEFPLDSEKDPHPFDIMGSWKHDKDGNVIEANLKIVINDNVWNNLSQTKKDNLLNYLGVEGFEEK